MAAASDTESSQSAPEYTFCQICAWRRHYIQAPDDDDETDAPPWACDSEIPEILAALHEIPAPIWIDIISTDRLCSPSGPIARGGRNWISIPLRCDADVQISDCEYKYEGDDYRVTNTVIAFHNTKLESLVRGTPCWDGRTNGSGILNEGRLRYGCCTHKG